MTIDELTKSIATLEAEIAEMQTQLKRAGEDREMENKDFQTTVADQRETKALLKKAYDVLSAVFAKKFLQVSAKQEPVGPPPPPGFKEYKQSSGAGGVMGMLEQIMRDTETLEAEAIKAESDAEEAKETAMNEQQQLMNENADLHKSCDFTLKNFDIR